MKLYMQEIRFWLPYVILVASPAIAYSQTKDLSLPLMPSLLVCLLTLYFVAFVTSRNFYQQLKTTLVHRALIWGLRIRISLAVLSVPGILEVSKGFHTMNLTSVSIDFWTGIGAYLIRMFLPGSSYLPGGGLDATDDLGTLILAIIYTILTILQILFLAFFTLIILTFRKNRQAPPAHLPSESVPR